MIETVSQNGLLTSDLLHSLSCVKKPEVLVNIEIYDTLKPINTCIINDSLKRVILKNNSTSTYESLSVGDLEFILNTRRLLEIMDYDVFMMLGLFKAGYGLQPVRKIKTEPLSISVGLNP